MTGITLSTRVGRLSETLSDNCIQLTQLPRWEGWRRTARWRVRKTCRCLNKLLVKSAETSGALRVGCKTRLQKIREVWRRKREGPWKQTNQIGQLAQKFIWQVRDSSVPESFHNLKPPSSLGSGWNEIHCPPACELWWG